MNKTVFLTHYDLDAAGAYIIAKHAFDPVLFKCQGYPKVDASIDYLISKQGGQDIVVADLCLSVEQAQKLCDNFENVLYFDHHQESLNIVKLAETTDNLTTVYHDNLCSTALVYKYWIEEMGGKPTSGLSHFAQVVEVYDNWRTGNKLWFQAYAMNEQFWDLHFFKFVVEYADGFTSLTPTVKQCTIDRITYKKQLIKDAPIIELESGSNIILFETADALNDVVLFKPEGTYYMIFKSKPELPFALSARSSRKDVEVNVGLALEQTRSEFMFVSEAGGHEKAGGASFQDETKVDDITEFIEAVDKLVVTNSEEIL